MLAANLNIITENNRTEGTNTTHSNIADEW
jgi:hypothetical protein